MRKDNLFILRFVNLSVFLILEGLAIFMISQTSLVQKSGIIKGLHSVNAALNSSIDNIGDYFSLKHENRILAQENALLRKQNSSMQEYIKETTPVSVDSALSEYAYYTFIPAGIISNQTNKQHNVIIIDKGINDGVMDNMGIITANGVIGYVLSAGERYSVVCSLLDTDNMVSATISSSNTFGTMFWNGKSTKRAILKDIPIHTEFNVGDTVTTSGYSMIYPPGLPIATINGKSKNNGINYELSVDLIEDFNTINTVYAVCFTQKQEIDSLLKKIGEK